MDRGYAHVGGGGGSSLASTDSLATDRELELAEVGLQPRRPSGSGRDLEVVQDDERSPHSASAGAHSAYLSSLSPPLLAHGGGVPLMEGVGSEPLYRNKFLRCACEVLIIVLAIVLAYLAGASRSQSSPAADCPAVTPSPSPSTGGRNKTAPVIVVSFDGFRADYLDLVGLARIPNLHALRTRRDVVVASALTPQFPALTFVNHYSLATGLYPAAHGIQANHMFDSDTGESFSYTDPSTQTRAWFKGKPIWVLAKEFGVKSGAVFWVGSDVAGQTPSVWLPYDEGLSNPARIEAMFSWIDRGECELCMIYFSTVDSAGHRYGAASAEVLDAVAQMDVLVGAIQSRLSVRGLADSAALVLLSDHGMASVQSYIFLDDYLDLRGRGLSKQEFGAFLTLWTPLPVDPLLVDEVMRNLTNIPAEQMQCWRKADLPAKWFYGAGSRVAPITCLCKEGWVTSAHDTSSSFHYPATAKGLHGYDPASPHMQAIFHAVAPGRLDSGVADRAGVIDQLSNLNVFNFICYLLNISPSPNNGTLADFAPFLVR